MAQGAVPDALGGIPIFAVGISRALLVAIAIGVASASDLQSESVSTCAPPQIDTSSWQIITLKDCGIRLKLPTRYRKEECHVIAGSCLCILRAGFGDNIDISEDRFGGSASDRKLIRQNDYENYEECAETIGGRAAVLQVFRGGGIITGPQGEKKTYHVEAIWEARPGLLVRLSGNCADERAQKEILAAAWTAEFDDLDQERSNKTSVRVKMFFSSVLGWLILTAPLTLYLVVAGLGGYVVFARKRRLWKDRRPARYRAYVAAYLALVLTPSVVSDFFLFMIPAPALIGFFFLLPAILFSNQRLPFLIATTVYHLLPIVACFGLIYFGLSAYSRFRSRRASPPI